MATDFTNREIETSTNFEKTLNYLKEFWFIVLFIGTLIVAWTTISNDIKYQDARISALEARSNVFDQTLSKMAADVSYIRGKLESR